MLGLNQEGRSASIRVLVPLGLAYFLVQLLVAFYHMGGGDEGTWLYHGYMVFRGYWPVFDFLTQHPVGSSLPYAAIFHLLSPSWEAARFLSALFCFGATVMASLVVWRRQGWPFALVTFLILALNVSYQSRTIQVYSMSPMTFGLMASYFCLLFPDRVRLGHFILAGLFLGFAGAARLPALALGLIIAVFALYQSGPSLGRRIGNVFAAGLAALVPLIPEIKTLIADPTLYLYHRWGSTSDVVTLRLASYGIEPTTTNWIKVVLRGWADYLTLGGFYAPHQNTWVTLLLGGIVLLALVFGQAGRRLSTTTLWAILFCIAGVLAGSISWLLVATGAYLSFTYPILAVVIGSLMGDLWRVLPPARRRPVALAAALILLPYTAMGLGHGVWQVMFRNNGGFTQPTTIAAAACWVRDDVRPDQPVFSAWPGELVLAERMMPRGLEAADILKDWYSLTDEQVDRLRIPRLSQLRTWLKSGAIPFLLDDNVKDVFERAELGNVWADMEAQYTLYGTVGGGVFPLRVFTHHSVDASSLPPLPRSVCA